MHEHESVTDAVIALLKREILPDLGLASFRDITSFRLSSELEFNAFISYQPEHSSPYAVTLTHEVPSRIIDSLRKTANDESCARQFGLTDGASVGLDDVDLFLSLALASATMFVLLHEVAHAVGGHFDYWSSKHPSQALRARFDEIGHFGLDEDQSDSMTPDDSKFSRMAELEADGLAIEVVQEFRRDLAALLVYDDAHDALLRSSDDISKTLDDYLARATLAGPLVAVAHLEQERSSDDRAMRHATHPFAETRFLNLMLRTLPIHLDAHKLVEDRQEWMSFEDPRAKEDLVRMLRSIAFPSQAIAAVAVPRRSSWRLEPASPFTEDLIGLITAGAASRTDGGRELVYLSDERTWFVAELEGFRKTNWWTSP